MEKLAVFASGRGSNFKAILDHIRLGVLQGVEVGVLISNKPNVGALEIAERYGIKSKVIQLQAGDRLRFEREALEVLEARGIDLIALAGFLQILTPYFLNRYRWRVMNLHPTLLPAFPGLRPYRQVLTHGTKVSGCTIYYADESVDGGPIILQHAVPVLEDDTEETLAQRILKFEHRLYPKAIQLHVDGRLKLEGRRVRIDYGGGWEERWNERQRAYIEHQERGEG